MFNPHERKSTSEKFSDVPTVWWRVFCPWSSRINAVWHWLQDLITPQHRSALVVYHPHFCFTGKGLFFIMTVQLVVCRHILHINSHYMLLGRAILPSLPPLWCDCDQVTDDKREEFRLCSYFPDSLLRVIGSDTSFCPEEEWWCCLLPWLWRNKSEDMDKAGFFLCPWRRRLKSRFQRPEETSCSRVRFPHLLTVRFGMAHSTSFLLLFPYHSFACNSAGSCMDCWAQPALMAMTLKSLNGLLLLLLSCLSHVWLCVTPEMAVHEAPPSLGFSRQEHWSGLLFPSPMHESEKWKWSHSVVSDS